MLREEVPNFDELTGRERLEFEVSQLADGTLAADRRAAVEAAVAADPALRSLLDDFRRVDARLSATPSWSSIDLGRLTGDVMHVVRLDAELDENEGPAPLRLPAAAPAATGVGWRLNLFGGAVAAAAMLVLGVGLGALLMSGSDAGPGSLDVTGPGPVATQTSPGDQGRLSVAGPAMLAAQQVEPTQGATPASVAVLSVSGPDVATAFNPDVQSIFPDYAGLYAASDAVVEPPSRVVVAAVEPGQATAK